MYDVNSLEDCLRFGELRRAYASYGITSTPVLRVFETLVESDIDGVVCLVTYKLIGVPYSRTGFNVDRPVEGIEPQGLFLASPKLDNFDVIEFKWDCVDFRRHLRDSAGE